VDFWVWGQPGLQSEFQDSQGYTEKPCLKKPQKKKKNYILINEGLLYFHNFNVCFCLSFEFQGEKNNGFDVLYHNMKHGQISTKELADFVRERYVFL
jgi:hypothetical protein